MTVKRGIFAKRRPARQHNIEAKLRVGFLLTPRFTLTAFAGFIDALRLAADEGDRSRPRRCRWDVLGTEGTPILSSCGTGVLPTAPYGSPEAYDYLVVVRGLLPGGQKVPVRFYSLLRETAAAGGKLVGLGTGCCGLERAGFLCGHVASVGWFHREECREE